MNKEPQVGERVIDSRTGPHAVRGEISLVNDRTNPDRVMVMVDWLPRMMHNPELVCIRSSEWSKTQDAWILSKTPNQDDLCFDPVSKRVGRVWGVEDSDFQALVIWASDLGTLTDIFIVEMARADKEDTDESPLAVSVEFDDMAYSEVGRFWNVLVHKETS